jgi:methylated-DNA-[protein]-cysteine S-methyltransferase
LQLSQKVYYPSRDKDWIFDADCQAFEELRNWLNDYFSGNFRDVTMRLRPEGTDFQKKVWQTLHNIPYGQTMTYGAIARMLRINSARAIGNAVSRNPITILIPCHRVVGADGRLTGYAGGLERKSRLLELERKSVSH